MVGSIWLLSISWFHPWGSPVIPMHSGLCSHGPRQDLPAGKGAELVPTASPCSQKCLQGGEELLYVVRPAQLCFELWFNPCLALMAWSLTRKYLV